MALEHYPECSVKPPHRCGRIVSNRPKSFCGALAAWLRAGNALFDDAYFCDAHRSVSDVPIPDTTVVNRVRLSVRVLFAGVSPLLTEARAEAVERLQRAVAAAGGVLQVEDVGSSLVRYGPLPPVGQGNGGRSHRAP